MYNHCHEVDSTINYLRKEILEIKSSSEAVFIRTVGLFWDAYV